MYMRTEKAPFIWGVQYHRAPTHYKRPERLFLTVIPINLKKTEQGGF